MVYRMIQLLVVLMLLAGTELSASDADSRIQGGVELHDAGDFDAAIQTFKSVLEDEPGNTKALYELANSYFAKGDFKACIATAKTGLEHPSRLDVGFHTIAGTCYSSSGKTEKALESFRSGLEIAPGNAGLNFNLAITLFNSGDRRAATEHLETAVDAQPSYSSPYFLLGEIYRQDGDRVPSLFYFARFFTLELNTSRSVSAARAVFGVLFSGIEMKSEGDIEITVPNLEEDNPKSVLEILLSMAGVAVHTEEVGALPSEAHRKVHALTNFLQIVLEMSEEDKAELESAVFWKQGVEPILRIHQHEASEALGFLLAMRADIEGAAEWLRENPQKLDLLEDVLVE